MAVLNVTPDSFFDGNRYDGGQALQRIDELAAEGAWVIDIGAESTRPGAPLVPTTVQLERLEGPVRYAVAKLRCWVSVDTSDPAVADAVLSWGAHVINDVSGLREPQLARVVQRHRAALILMHARGPMSQMAGYSSYPEDGYGDVITEVIAEWSRARDDAEAHGLSRDNLLFDPGIGFAKSAQQSMALIRRLGEFSVLNTPVVVGPSRKSFFNLIEQCEPEARLGATVACCLHAADLGAALVRVHDVHVVAQALSASRFFRAKLAPENSHGLNQEASCSMA